MVRRIMHIDLDAFFVSVEQRDDPSLKGKPVVVGGRADSRGVVASASYEARAFGIRAGMPLSGASRLCPEAIFIPGSFSKYRQASEEFMAILADFSPFLEPLGIDEAYLDATGFESLHGSIRDMAIKIKQRIKNELRITASVGISSSKVVAKVASDLSKPDGLIEVKAGDEARFLAPLSVRNLPGVGKKTERILSGLSIKTIGKLSTMSQSALKSYFGASGEVLYRFSRGMDERKVEPPQAAKSISRETTFSEDTGDISFIKATLRYLSERVGSDLRQRGRRAASVNLKLRYGDFTTLSRSLTLPKTTDSDQAIFESGLKLLNKMPGREKKPIRLIGIGVSKLVEAEKQLDMLDSSAERLEKLERAVDRIRRKYGFASIQTGQTLLLKDIFPTDKGDYTLNTPSLSR